MPSFDIVSEVDMREASNAVDQSSREVSTRFDFKGSSASFKLNKEVIELHADSEFQLQQMRDILNHKMSKRGIDIACLDTSVPRPSGKGYAQEVTVRQGLDSDLSKKISKLIKESKLKVQAQIQGEKVRVTGKKRDDLQEAIALLRETKLEMPLQFNNFRD